MHGVSCQLRLPQHQLINKWHHDKTAPKTKEHRGDTGSKACQCNNCDIVQENIPDLKNERADYTGSILLPICAALQLPL
ncbi:Uncharacterised protein [Leclercia adecarboxylata]|uniref:Uncharacterized protein n=1 Tax=Leclercia adecarboxylata TaxID=83655 RepID=A0A4U9HXE9_9ENTR|nr:Uncharacterised protein [Leclercia adecarboxylata]